MSVNSKVEGFVDALKNRILAGEFGNNGKLPSFRSLASEYNTTQETMNKTMQSLQAEGLLTSKGTKGVFVNAPSSRLLPYTPNFYRYLQEKHLDPTKEDIEKPAIIKVPADIAKFMKIEKDINVIRRFQKQTLSNTVFRLEEAYFPQNILTEKIQNTILNNSHYMPFIDIKSNSGLFIKYANEIVLSRFPSHYEQKLLKIVRTNPVIDIKRTLLDKDKKNAIFYQHLIINANLFYLSYNYEVDYSK